MTIPGTLSRRTVIFWLMLSSAISAAWGFWIEHTNEDGLGDFRAIYFGARAVMAHHDPYKPDEFLRVYLDQGGKVPTDPIRLRSFMRAVPFCINLPSTLLVVAPLALLNWVPAHLVWMTLLSSGLMLCAWLIWDLAGARAPGLTLFLLCLVMANCEVVLQLGNGSVLAVSLCVVAVWCFFKQRYETAGVVCFALGLAIKPQEIGLIWLFFLLAGGIYRRRAWQVAGVALVLVVLSVLWVSQASPYWIQEWRGNIAATSVHGDLNDPGPTSIGNKSVGMIVSLQSVISFFWDDPRVYNPATYLLAGGLVLILCIFIFRSRRTEEGRWLAIGSMAALSLLPIYHRQYDTKLLLLIIPACAVLWAHGGPIRKVAALVTAAGIVFTSDIPVAVLVLLHKSLNLPQDQLAGKCVSILLTRTPTLGLILVGSFYLWAYIRHESPAKAVVPSQVSSDPKFELATLSAWMNQPADS